MPSVNGKSRAIAIEGPSPGRVPPRMPQSTPPNAVATVQGSVKACIESPPNSVPAGNEIPITRTKPNQNTPLMPMAEAARPRAMSHAGAVTAPRRVRAG